MFLFAQCLEIWPNCWHLKQQTTGLMYFTKWSCVPSMLIPSLSSLSQRVSSQVKQAIGRGWWLYEEWNRLTWTFSWLFSSIMLVRSSVVILGFIFFIMIFLCFLKDWGIEQVLPGSIVFISCSKFFISSSVLRWIDIPPLGRSYVYFISIFLVAASVILLLISGEFFGLRFSGRLPTIVMRLFLFVFSEPW